MKVDVVKGGIKKVTITLTAEEVYGLLKDLENMPEEGEYLDNLYNELKEEVGNDYK